MYNFLKIRHWPVHQTHTTNDTGENHDAQHYGSCSSWGTTRGWNKLNNDLQMRKNNLWKSFQWPLRHFFLSLTHCYIDYLTRHGKTDIICQRHVEAEYACLVEELTKDHLTVWRGRSCITDGLDRCDTVSIRNDSADLAWQTTGKRVMRIVMTWCQALSLLMLETTHNKALHMKVFIYSNRKIVTSKSRFILVW